MKKILSLLLVIAMLLSLCACGKKEPIEDKKLVSKLHHAIISEILSVTSGCLPEPKIYELEEIESGKYNASGDLLMIFVKQQTSDYWAFTAIMTVDENGEVEIESLDLD
jgi:hypothetical protein